jgi:hypothetical protein
MRIPNKFNGYSADNRRIYNNPALVVPFVANMGTGAAAAAATAAATQAATTATTATQTAAPVLETTAGLPANQVSALTQGGINPAAAPPVAPPGTPLPPAQPLPPAGGTPFTPPTAPPPGTVPPGASDAFHAQEAARLKDYLNNSTASLDSAAKPTGLEKTFDFNRTVDPVNYAESLAQPPVNFEGLGKAAAEGAAKTGNALLDGFNLVKKFAGEAYEGYKQAPLGVQLGSTLLLSKSLQDEPEDPKKDNYKRTPYAGLSETFEPGGTSKYLYGFADGGITGGGPVEQMSNMNAIGGNEMYPMANIPRLEYANPVQQRPVSENIMTMGGDTPTDPYTGQLKFSGGGSAEDKKTAEEAAQRKRYAQMLSGKSGSDLENDIAQGQAIAAKARGSGVGIIPRSRAQTLSSPNAAAQTEMAAMMKKYGIKAAMPKTLDPQSGSAGAGESDYAGGGVAYGLGGYSDGGRLLKGPGDGVSDSIPAQIGDRQPARLADGEFVIPARIVSELGNGSTEAGARQLYAMMERVQKGRKKSVGKGKVAVDSKAK